MSPLELMPRNGALMGRQTGTEGRGNREEQDCAILDMEHSGTEMDRVERAGLLLPHH